MKQMEVDASRVIRLDYEAESLPKAVREFRPLVFQEGDLFCCVLGPNPQIGVFGCGATQEEAIKDWNEDLKRKIRDGAGRTQNEVTQYILDTMSLSKNDIW
jgi:hypothetical protein